MTKAVICVPCGQIVGPISRWEENRDWNWCADPCHHTGVRWRDGYKGLLEVTSFHGALDLRVIGLHNGFLQSVTSIPMTHAGHRGEHERATHAPGYLFDRSKRDCWAVVVRVGESNDVFFIPYEEATND